MGKLGELTALIGVSVLLLSPNARGQQAAKELTPSAARSISPVPPSHVRVSETASGLRVSWSYNALDTAAHFKVYRISADLHAEPLGTVRGGYFLDSHPPGGKVSYRVTAVNGSGVESQPSVTAPAPPQ